MRSMSTAFDPVDLTPRRRSVRRSSDRVMRVRPSPTSAAERAFFRAPVGDGGVAAAGAGAGGIGDAAVGGAAPGAA